MAVDESLSASVSRYRERRAVRCDPRLFVLARCRRLLQLTWCACQALDRSSGNGIKGGRNRAAHELDRRAATTLRIWRQKSRAAVLARNRSARLLVGWRRHRQVANRFGWWAAQIGRHADLRERLAVLLCRRVRSTLTAALEQWQHGAAASRRVKESELQRWREWAHVESYQRRRISSGVRHLLHRMRTRYLRASFEAWGVRGERKRRLAGLLTLSLGAQPVELQRDAFRDWRCSMRWTCRSEWREDPAVQRMQRLALAKMNFRGMSTLKDCLRLWQQTVARRRRSRGVLSNCLLRMQHSLLSCALNGWCANVQSKKERKHRATRAVARMLNAHVAGAFAQWRDTTKLVKSRRDVAQRAVKRLQDNFLFSSLNRWCDVVKRQKALRTIGQRAAKRLKNSSLFAALDTWQKTVRSVKQRRVVGSRAVAKMLHALLASALLTWQQHVQRLKLHRKICTRALQRLFRVMLASAFWGWQESAAEKRRRWTVIERAVQRLTRRLAASAFNSWMSSANQQRKLRQSVHAIVMRLANKTLANALDAWSHSTELQRRIKATGERTVHRLRNLGLARAFGCWCVTTVEKRKHRQLCRLVVNRVYRRYTVVAFEHWAEIVSLAAENSRHAAEQALAASTVDAAVLDSLVKEYDAAKVEWGRRWEEMSGELAATKNSVRTLRQQLEQTRARSTVAIKQASMRRAEEVAAEQEKHESALEAERQKNSQLADTIVALRAEMERMTSESATRVYIQSVCEDTLMQLMEGNERLRREKLALESTILPKQQKEIATAATSATTVDLSESKNMYRPSPLAASDGVRP